MDFNDHVGYAALGMQGGSYVIELLLDQKHLNQFGFVHGGVLFTMLDTALSRACFSELPEGGMEGVTLEMKINYLKSVQGGVLRACGKLVNLTKRTGYVEGYIENEAQEMIARASGTIYITAR